MFGYTFKCAGLVTLIYLKTDLNWFFVPYAVEGISGNYVGVLLGLFLYTSDISGRNRSRTTAMVILEGVRSGTTAALNIVVGKMIQQNGFMLPGWISLAASVSGLLLIFALPNRKPQVLAIPGSRTKAGYTQIQDDGIPDWKSWMSMFAFPAGTFNDQNVKKMFISALAATFLMLVAMLGMKKVQSLYLMNEPICWSSSMIGWFSFGSDLSANMVTIFIGPLLIRCLPGMIVGVLGMLSEAGGYLFLALADTGFKLYFQPALSIGHQIPMGMIRGELSRLVGSEAQGTMFATIAVLESFSFAVGSTFLYVYNATLGFYKGTVALVGAFILFVAAWILM
ncbi:solute carrier family 46, member 1 [Elysia marginata]|uniref:Solute carrier family 46, member 1 n=1 Tax=Elysia marginata TaxID=1093978 RepID=A0AAV4FH58_9GAST|nr:solute carrier family 46, member 1 [Elysia marginata]